MILLSEIWYNAEKHINRPAFVYTIFMLAAAFALTAVGVAVIYATGHPAPLDSEPAPITAEKPEDAPADAKTPEPENQAAEVILPDEEPAHKLALNWRKQVLYFLFGLAGFLVVNIIGYRRLGPISYGLYAVILILLAVLLLDMVIDIPFVPYRENCARRWIEVLLPARQFFRFNRRSFAKLPMFWRWRITCDTGKFRHLLGLIGLFALTLLAMVLILLEPDLGTVILMMPILFAMLFAAGPRATSAADYRTGFGHKPDSLDVDARLPADADFQSGLQSPRIRTLARKHPPLARILVAGRNGCTTGKKAAAINCSSPQATPPAV